MVKKLPEMLCRWNAFEQPVRAALRAYKDGTVSADRTLQALDAYLAAATRRGNDLDEVDNEWQRVCWDWYESNLARMYPNEKRYLRKP